MTSVSKKHKAFASEPMREKPVSDLPGIGEVLGDRLASKGFNEAYSVLAEFLRVKKDQTLFKKWLKDKCDANADQQKQCYQGLKDWCDSFL